LSSGFAILVLRQFFKTDYRGVVQMLHGFSDLRRVLGLKKVPHYSTLRLLDAVFDCYAEQRLVKKGLSIASWRPVSDTPPTAA